MVKPLNKILQQIWLKKKSQNFWKLLACAEKNIKECNINAEVDR